jgi:hypothetical protein
MNKPTGTPQETTVVDTGGIGSADNSGVADALHNTFGKADPVAVHGITPGSWLYGGSPEAAQANQAMLQNYGDTSANASIATGQGLYANSMQRAGQMDQQAYANAMQGQQQAAGGINLQQQSAQGVGNWLGQGPGPSVAQAQLAQQNNANVANAMALAASGRGQGGGAAAQQAAAFQAANMGQQTNQQATVLRAQEAQNWRQQQLQGMGMQSSIGANIAQQGQGQQQLGLGYNQLGAASQQSGNASLLNAMGQGQQTQLGYMNLGQQQLQNQAQSLTQQQIAQQQADIEAQKANQQSTYQHQSGVAGMLSTAAGALAFL